MPLFNLRNLIPYPAGSNASDIIINGTHFNRTALDYWNYTLNSNGTLSNFSSCYLTMKPFVNAIILLPNGTFLNATSCYAPIDPIQTHAKIGISFSIVFTIILFFLLIALKKHGKQLLPSEKRFRPVGRRWMWYWLIFTSACGIISGFMAIDVDRNYLQGAAIIMQSIFYSFMTPVLVAALWEGVRNWGSWEERQIVHSDQDRDHFFRQDDMRGKIEFYMPLVFYLFAFLSFFMVVPRTWNNIQLQRDPIQQETYAKRVATDGRFKAGSIIVILAYFVILYCVGHNAYYYRKHANKFWKNGQKFLIVIPILAIRLAYGVACAFNWTISPYKYDVNNGWMYGLGYVPVAIIMIVLLVYGFIEPNEDKELLRQKNIRQASVDAELGIKLKPSWWGAMHGNRYGTADTHLKNLINNEPMNRKEEGFPVQVAAPRFDEQGWDTGEGGARRSHRPTDKQGEWNSKPFDLFKDETPAKTHTVKTTERTESSDSGSGRGLGRQQRVKSMLDV